jgi:hypothetical protein
MISVGIRIISSTNNDACVFGIVMYRVQCVVALISPALS